MNREIKFRVWDKDMKNMRICGSDTHDSMYFDQDGNTLYYNLQNGCGSLPDGTGTYDLMQFTGLRDKNGKEIYEGDVLKSSLASQQIGDVRFFEGSWFIFWNQPNQYTSFLNGNTHSLEVIGNIYEHPQLLEGVES